MFIKFFFALFAFLSWQYRKLNQDKLNEYDKARNNTEKRKQQRKDTYLRHRDKRIQDVKIYYSENKERLNSLAKQRIKLHPEKARANWNNRDARRRVSGWCKLTDEQIKNMFNIQKGLCFYCNEPLKEYHIDHIVPLCKGGKHEFSNLVLSCPKCNLSKNSQDPEIFVNKIIKEKYGGDIKTIAG